MKENRLTREDCRKLVEQNIFPTADDAAPDHMPSIGIELENFPYRDSADGPQPVPLYGPDSTTEALMEISDKIQGATWKTKWDEDGNEKIYRVDIGGNSILFEPGGQVEISTRPARSLGELEQHLQSMQYILAGIKESHGIQFGQHGIDPWIGKGKLSNQLCFPRYRALQEYFDAVGPYGRQMMFHTCGLHINMDTGHDDDTRIRRIVLANLLSPFATAMFANSPGVEHDHYKSYRSHIWRKTDPLRTGMLPLGITPDRNTLVEGYLRFALKAPLIHIPRLGARVLPGEITLERWLEAPVEGQALTVDDLSYHLTLLFPEVRLKGYLEIRSVDAPPPVWQMVPVLFYAGLLYNAKQTEQALQYLGTIGEDMDRMLEEASLGLKDGQITRRCNHLMKLAMEGLDQLPAGFVEEKQKKVLERYYTQFTTQGRTFADLDLFS